MVTNKHQRFNKTRSCRQ